MSKEIELTDANFDEIISNSELPVIVDFWAPWCGPCKFMSPVLSEIAAEKSENLNVAKLNVDDNPNKSTQFGISGIPTLLFFKDGKEIDRVVGALPKQMLEQAIQKNFES
ncbi:MAG: thioredoxin [Calditrichaeota bacterium]|jgi:thioredoxin 1|nr:thioredoxin [Calditrichota bacterium]MBT7787689.1 thioredoxin [Calditrichota bacterium]